MSERRERRHLVRRMNRGDRFTREEILRLNELQRRVMERDDRLGRLIGWLALEVWALATLLYVVLLLLTVQ